MKRATAFILSIVYLAFAFGSLGHEPTITGVQYSYANAVADIEEAGAVTPDTSDENSVVASSFLLKKVHKHLATVAKVKLPRPGVINSSLTSYFVPEHHTITGTHQLRTGTPLWSSATLYLKNCVFLI